jgi:RNA polymerase sigma-70 factor (ECF subfamily)
MKANQASYPGSFHIGFVQESEQRVNEIYQQLQPDGDPRLLESVRTTEMAETNEPGQPIDVWTSIMLATLLVLEQSPPFEQAVFLLHTVFAHEFAEIALLLGMQEVACRRSFHQARAYLRKHRPRFPLD